MSPRAPHAIGFRSIFAKLLSIMLVMAACLLFAVSFFFMAFVVPGVNDALGRMERELATLRASIKRADQDDLRARFEAARTWFDE